MTTSRKGLTKIPNDVQTWPVLKAVNHEDSAAGPYAGLGFNVQHCRVEACRVCGKGVDVRVYTVYMFRSTKGSAWASCLAPFDRFLNVCSAVINGTP